MLLILTTDHDTITNDNDAEPEFFDHARCVVACYFSLMFFMFLLISTVIWLSVFEETIEALALQLVFERV